MGKMKTLGYASLVYGGFLIITYIAFCYFAFWRQEFIPSFPDRPPGPDLHRDIEPLSIIISPQALAILGTGIFLVINGYSIIKSLEQKEKAETKKFIVSSMLTDDEKAVFDELARNSGQSTQKLLSSVTGFSAVRTYRTIKRLEEKKLVKSFPFGMTKKVMLVEK